MPVNCILFTWHCFSSTYPYWVCFIFFGIEKRMELSNLSAPFAGNKKPEGGELVDAPGEEKILRSGDAPEMEEQETEESDSDLDDMALWANAWRVWLSIETTATIPPDMTNNTNIKDVYIPSQAFLSALIQIFPPLYAHIKARFVTQDLQKLSTGKSYKLTCNLYCQLVMFQI